MSEAKTKPTTVSVKNFINKVDDEQKKSDSKILIELMTDITGKKPQMWGPSIVGFDSYHYKYETGREGDMPIVGFSPRKQAMTIYIMSGFTKFGDELKELGKHKLGKSCLYIKKLADVDIDVLRQIIEKSIERVSVGDIIY